MPTLKAANTPTTIVFDDGSFVDKLKARNSFLDEADPANPILTIEFAHYSKSKRDDPEGTDFEILLSKRDDIRKLVIRDATIANKVKAYNQVSMVFILIDEHPITQLTVNSQKTDLRDVEIEF